MTDVGVGVVGARSFVATRAVMPAVEESDGARLVAVAARGGDVPERWSALDVGSYEAVIDHPEVEVVYLPLPNGMHAEWAARAADAGKHVLCEKPLAPDAATAATMLHHARLAGVSLIEAWMTPFSRPWAGAVARARHEGVTSVATRFTFTIGPDQLGNYRWDPDQGGGAMLDVGIYALGPVVALWGAEPDRVRADIARTDRGVDHTVRFDLAWDDGRRARGTVSFAMPEAQELHLAGPTMRLSLSGDAHTGEPGTYTRMIDAVADHVRGRATFPRTDHDVVSMLALVDRIRSQGIS